MALFGKWFAAAAAPAAPSVSGGELPNYPTGLADADIDAVFARARAELEMKTAMHIATWAADQSRWDADLEIGTLTFTNPSEWQIIAPVQVIGTYSLNDQTFLWGWDHPSVPSACAQHARRVRAFGEAQGLSSLMTRKIAVSEAEAWELTALALHLSGANGGYRGPSGQTLVFMTYGEVTISKP